MQNGRIIGFTAQYQGSVADMDTFHRNVCFQSRCLKVTEEERSIEESEILAGKYPLLYVCIVGKGYHGGGELMGIVSAVRKRTTRMLTMKEDALMKKLDLIASFHRTTLEDCVFMGTSIPKVHVERDTVRYNIPYMR